MLLRDELFNFTKEYTDAERVFKTFYFTKDDPKLLREFFDCQTPELQVSVNNWILAEKGELLTEFTENTESFNFLSNVLVTHHSRFCPAFVHKHTFFEIVVLLSGSCVNCIDGQELFLSEGDVCIIAPGVYHALRDSKDSIIYNVLVKHYDFSDSFGSFLLQRNVLSSFFMQSLYSDNYQRFITFHTKGDLFLQELICILILENVVNKDSSVLSESLLNSVFNCLVLRHVDENEHSIFVNTDSQLILKIKQFITNNMRDACLSSLSEEFNYSPTYLSKLVSKLTGSNVSNIIRRVRIDKACSLLSNTNLSVTEIGVIVGYNSTRQFNRAFFDLINKTPKEYRQRNKSLIL